MIEVTTIEGEPSRVTSEVKKDMAGCSAERERGYKLFQCMHAQLCRWSFSSLDHLCLFYYRSVVSSHVFFSKKKTLMVNAFRSIYLHHWCTQSAVVEIGRIKPAALCVSVSLHIWTRVGQKLLYVAWHMSRRRKKTKSIVSNSACMEPGRW